MSLQNRTTSQGVLVGLSRQTNLLDCSSWPKLGLARQPLASLFDEMSVFSVSTAGGATYEVAAAALENVMQLRLELEKQIHGQTCEHGAPKKGDVLLALCFLWFRVDLCE